jgi:cyclic pyranopterin phosphate synthase
MPEKDYAWLPRQDILHFEEIGRLAGVFAGAGVDRVRLTGGEPLVRRNLPDLVAILARDARLRDIAMTTNGVLLAEHARDLRAAGLHRVPSAWTPSARTGSARSRASTSSTK